MTAKEYLSQYRLAKIKIKQLNQELLELKSTLEYSGFEWETKVQTSPRDALSESVIKALDLEQEIKGKINESVRVKRKIISELHQLTNPLFVEILYRRYIENKNLWVISQEMNYTHMHIRRAHGWALQAFGDAFLKDDTQ